MARRTFFSFHYDLDNWRAGQVRNMGLVEGNTPVSDNHWEAIKRGGDSAIKKWIEGELQGRTCTVVLIGSRTAGRKWINYEIKQSWDRGKGVLGIYIHNLKDRNSAQTPKGKNPFEHFRVEATPLSSIVRAYDPPYKTSTNVYNYIKEHIAEWVEEAILLRSRV